MAVQWLQGGCSPPNVPLTQKKTYVFHLASFMSVVGFFLSRPEMSGLLWFGLLLVESSPFCPVLATSQFRPSEYSDFNISLGRGAPNGFSGCSVPALLS